MFGVLSLVLEKLFQLLFCGCEAALGACFASCIILPGMDATVVKKKNDFYSLCLTLSFSKMDYSNISYSILVGSIGILS